MTTLPSAILNVNTLRVRGTYEGYQYADSNGISSTALLSATETYHRTIRRNYQTLQVPALTSLFTGNEPFAISTKYDGMGVFVYYSQEHDLCLAFTQSGRTLLGMPALEALKDVLKASGRTSFLCAAELYLQTERHRATVSDVIHASASGDVANLGLALFDILLQDGKRWEPDSYSSTWDELSKYDTPLAHRVEGSILPAHKLKDYFEVVTDKGEEGCVLRSLTNSNIWKIKPKLTIDAVVIGYIEDLVEGRHVVTSLLTGLSTADGIQEFCRIGSGFDDTLASHLLETLSPQKVEAPILASDSSGRLITFVKPTLVVEVLCDTLETLTYRSRTYSTNRYAYKDGVYKLLGRTTVPRPVFPVLSRLRPDKHASQPTDYAAAQVPGISSTLIPTVHADATVLRTIIATKGDAVRRINLYQTSHQFPYLVQYIDFSTNRATPLDSDHSVFQFIEDANTKVSSFMPELQKRGWNLVT